MERPSLSLEAKLVGSNSLHWIAPAGATDLPSINFLWVKNELRIPVHKVVSIELLHSITKKLHTANVCDVRNRIEHERTDFPHLIEISSCLEGIQDVFKQPENKGLFPSLFCFDKLSRDTFGRVEVTLENYQGKTASILLPLTGDPFNMLSDYTNAIVVPCITISNTCEQLRFRMVETSRCQKFWKNYPRLRLRDNNEEITGGSMATKGVQ